MYRWSVPHARPGRRSSCGDGTPAVPAPSPRPFCDTRAADDSSPSRRSFAIGHVLLRTRPRLRTPGDNQGLTATTASCHTRCMTPKPVAAADRKKFEMLTEVRTAALEHARLARKLSSQRRQLMTELVELGYSQADIAREMGVTRQAVQRMLAVG